MTRSFSKFERRLRDADLYDKLERLSLSKHVSLRDLYEAPRMISIRIARRAAYLWLMKRGKSVNEIALLFDRAPSGIHRMTRGSE